MMGVPMLACTLLVVLPVAAVVWRASGKVVVDTDGATLGAGELVPAVGRTLATTGAIAVIAVALALPTGWLMRGAGSRRGRLGALVLVPMLLPSYLAFAGWTLLRAPRTYLGDRLADAPAWVTDWVKIGIAVGGLALWSWPLAALVLGRAARRVDQGVLDALDLDGPALWRRLLILGRLMRPGIMGALVLVMLVMSGSMVPLDVSGLESYAIVLMRFLQQHPSDLPVWWASWPLVVVAVVSALVMVWLTGADDGAEGDERVREEERGGALVWTLGVWALGVVVPGVLFLLSLREPPHAATAETIRRFLWAFWRDSGSAVASSVSVAARVGALALVISVCVWFAASRGGRGARVAAVCAAMLTITGLVPGVLVGTAVRRGADMAPESIGASSWLVVMGHLARFAFVGALLALWLARRETREERSLRLIDGADTPRGFAHACLARQWGVVVGVGLATAILSVHEIEATVIIWPPGMRNLAQEMLDALHFQRDERMGAAAVNLLALGTGVAYLAGWLMLRHGARAHQELE